MAEPILELERLEVAYAGVPAVRNLSLSVDRGEIVGLIGPNGAGKSTTLRAIMGIVRPAGGDIRLAGRSIRGRAPERIARAGVALVPEGRRIYPNLTVDENLRLGLAARRGRARDDMLESLRELQRPVPGGGVADHAHSLRLEQTRGRGDELVAVIDDQAAQCHRAHPHRAGWRAQST